MYLIISIQIICNVICLLALWYYCRSSKKTEDLERIRHEMQDGMQKLFMQNNSVEKELSALKESYKIGLDSANKNIVALTQVNEMKLENIRVSIDKKLHDIQSDNNIKLEKMRNTVEEKLHETLESRLNTSFNIVSERLEQVYKGLGEMKNLASGVGDLKRVLSNVSTRGIWGEVQLGVIMEQILTPSQYAKDVRVNPASSNVVEFAVKLPAKDQDKSNIWLPLDAKFPLSDFQKLIEYQDIGDKEGIKQYSLRLERSVKKSAKEIEDKYIVPPYTTDFAIMFLPIEALYAQVLRIPGLIEELQSKHRVIITSPTTLSAILNSLQMGFKTLAIEKRSSEVWKILGSVKQEFVKFADVLGKTKTKLDQASKVIIDAETRTRAIQRRLASVEVEQNEEVLCPPEVKQIPSSEDVA